MFKLYTPLFSRTVSEVALDVWEEALLVLLRLDHQEVDHLITVKSAEYDVAEETAEIVLKISRNFVAVTCAQMTDPSHEKGLA